MGIGMESGWQEPKGIEDFMKSQAYENDTTK